MAVCKVGRLLEPDGFPLGDQDTLRMWLVGDLPRVPATVMAQALTAEGKPTGATTLKDHRTMRCACAS